MSIEELIVLESEFGSRLYCDVCKVKSEYGTMFGCCECENSVCIKCVEVCCECENSVCIKCDKEVYKYKMCVRCGNENDRTIWLSK